MEGTYPAGPGLARGIAWSVLALSALAAGCSNYIGTTAASYLRRAREDPDPNLRYVAYTKLAQPNCYDSVEQKSEAVRTMVAKLDEGKEPLATRAVILNTLGALRDRSARDAVLKFANDPEPVLRVQACRALGKVGKPEDATILARVMTVDALEDCRIAAIDALGELRANDPRITGMLVAGMRHEDPATRFASLKALRKITGKDVGLDAVAWQKELAKEGETQAAVASSSSTTTPPTESTASAPAYPPRPPAAPAIASADADPDTHRVAGLPAQPDPFANARPPGVGIGSYPATNPNLPGR